jgi:hypothetical protein
MNEKLVEILKLRKFVVQLIVMTFFLHSSSLGQTKYKYEYTIHLKKQESTYSLRTTDSSINGKSCINFHLLNKKRDFIPFATIIFKSKSGDTILFSNLNGEATIILPPDTLNLIVNVIGYSPLPSKKFYFRPNSMNDFKIIMGKSNELRVGHIHSSRKLKESEIQKIIEDISNDKEEDELLKSKICYILWDI